jgi:threonine/homoserine/homoserine lactone efflux protein
MKQDKKMSILFWGFLVSFLGSLPPGTTNILMVQLATTRGYEISSWFAVGCALSEILCVALCLTVVDRIAKSGALIKSLEWMSLLVIVWIVASSFATIKDPTKTFVPLLLSPFLSGVILMAINPVQLPFWAGWTTILIKRGRLTPSRRNHTLYMIGIAIGSLLASALFIICGHLIMHWMIGKQEIVQMSFVGILMLIAAIQVVKIIIRPKPYQSPGR